MRNFVILAGLAIGIAIGHLSVKACICPGVNPELYPPDIPASRSYYKNEFKGAAFTGKVLSSQEAPGDLLKGERVQELRVEIDRFWLGVGRRTVTIYAPIDRTGCWVPFVRNESYFFVPSLEDGFLYIGVCTYATYNRKSDGNYVDFMVKMFGKGKRFKSKR